MIDEKPKRLTGTGLKRMRNIAENPRIVLIIDHYEEEWSYLAYVLIHGQASSSAFASFRSAVSKPSVNQP